MIIMANGFKPIQRLHPLKVIGRESRDLEEVWAEARRPGMPGHRNGFFPKLLILFGPNTATGHTSVIFCHGDAVNYSF